MARALLEGSGDSGRSPRYLFGQTEKDITMINEFRGEYRFLSNFYICPGGIKFEDAVYRSVEHAYQAAKTLVQHERTQIRRCATPGEAKKAGYRVTLRADWEDVKVDIMLKLVLVKFYGSPDLKKKLLATGNQKLIEGNWWGDSFWGVDERTGKGENHLGKILMVVRTLVSSSARTARTSSSPS